MATKWNLTIFLPSGEQRIVSTHDTLEEANTAILAVDLEEFMATHPEGTAMGPVAATVH